MKDLPEIVRSAQPGERWAEGPLTSHLERRVEGYFVRGERAGGAKPWLLCYYDPDFQYIDYNSTVALTPENVIACVSLRLRLAFVRQAHLEHCARDVAGYGLALEPLESLEGAELRVRDPQKLPEFFRGVPWGEGGLDPEGFSALGLAEVMNAAQSM